MPTTLKFKVLFPLNPPLSEGMGKSFLVAGLERIRESYRLTVDGRLTLQADGSVEVAFIFDQPGIRGQYESVLDSVKLALRNGDGKYITRLQA